MHVYAIVSLQVNNSVSYTTWRFSSKIQQSRDCLLVYVYAYSCLMPISDRASNKRTHHHHPIPPKRNDHKLYISLVFCNSMYVHDCMKNLVLNIKINMMMVIICDINNSTVLVLRYCNRMSIHCTSLLKVITEQSSGHDISISIRYIVQYLNNNNTPFSVFGGWAFKSVSVLRIGP